MLTELHEMTFFERKALEEGAHTLAGIDEAGRGPLAGPVVAGACIFSEALCLEGLTDSKKLSEKKNVSTFLILYNSTPRYTLL